MTRKFTIAFFRWYIKFIIRRDFASFSFNTIEVDNSRSILLLANHFSWWDGFLMFHLNQLVFKKNFHVMVTEENYKSVWFLKFLGAFPVKKNSKSVLESLQYAGKLLNDEKNLVLIFPQGKLYSNHVEEVAFERGLINLINSSNRKFQYLFASCFVDYFEKRKASITCYLEVWSGAEFISLQLIKSEYNKHYESSRRNHCRFTI